MLVILELVFLIFVFFDKAYSERFPILVGVTRLVLVRLFVWAHMAPPLRVAAAEVLLSSVQLCKRLKRSFYAVKMFHCFHWRKRGSCLIA